MERWSVWVCVLWAACVPAPGTPAWPDGPDSFETSSGAHLPDAPTRTRDGEEPDEIPPVDPEPADNGGRALVFDGPPPKNLLVISIDTLRRDQLGRYAGDNLTPFLDRVAEEGVALDDFMQCSNWTFASTTCTMQGRSNIDAGFMPMFAIHGGEPVPDDTEFLPTWLAPAGFRSILKSTNYNFSPVNNNAQGFDDASETPVEDGWFAWGRAVQALSDMKTGTAPPDRWYVHVHVMEPHRPYDPPAEFRGEVDALPPIPVDLTDADVHMDVVENWDDLTPGEQDLALAHLWALYRGDVRTLDDLIRQIWEDAAARGMLDDTLVVLWSDHGEQFFEHGDQRHAYSLNREENDAIAIFWAPNLRPQAWTGPTTAPDIVPTVLDAFDLPIPDSVTGIPAGGASPDRARFAFTVGRGGVIQGVRYGRWHLIYGWAGRLSLYDVVADPTEAVDLYDPQHPMLPTLWGLLEPKVLEADPLVPLFTPELPVVE
ncbi:MAG: arylsulfatase A-like enzyme [Myxococcota bacterium]|jgi:arylsulfatase A-like enzyme